MINKYLIEDVLMRDKVYPNTPRKVVGKVGGQAGRVVGYVMGVIVIDSFFLIGLPIMLRGAETVDNDAMLLNKIDRQLDIERDIGYIVNFQGRLQVPNNNGQHLACYHP